MAVTANDATLTGLATAHTGSTAGHPAPNAPAASSFDLILQAAAGSVLSKLFAGRVLFLEVWAFLRHC